MGIGGLVGLMVGTTEIVPARWCCGHCECKNFLGAMFSAAQEGVLHSVVLWYLWDN